MYAYTTLNVPLHRDPDLHHWLAGDSVLSVADLQLWHSLPDEIRLSLSLMLLDPNARHNLPESICLYSNIKKHTSLFQKDKTSYHVSTMCVGTNENMARQKQPERKQGMEMWPMGKRFSKVVAASPRTA